MRYAVAVHPHVHESRRGLTRWAGAEGMLECYAEWTLVEVSLFQVLVFVSVLVYTMQIYTGD